jgi:hypothetical protein
MEFVIIAIIAFFVALVIWSDRIESRQIEIRHEYVESLVQKPVSLAFVSDFHFGFGQTDDHAARILKNLTILKEQGLLDIIILGGDFIDRSAKYLPVLDRFFHAIRQFGVPVVAVIGNHDLDARVVPAITEMAERWGVRLLQNESRHVRIGGSTIQLVGVRDMEELAEYKKLRRNRFADQRALVAASDFYRVALDGKQAETIILITHNPDGVYLPGVAPTITLAGHTHRGQFLPVRWLAKSVLLCALPVLPRGSFRVWAGRMTTDTGRELIVGAGVGGSSLRGRLLTPPEIVAVTLQPKSEAQARS